jgi:hypothetical protein
MFIVPVKIGMRRTAIMLQARRLATAVLKTYAFAIEAVVGELIVCHPVVYAWGCAYM